MDQEIQNQVKEVVNYQLTLTHKRINDLILELDNHRDMIKELQQELDYLKSNLGMLKQKAHATLDEY
jgi:predicted RNase H-like nuclease (RuvC/YqgF family)